MSGKDYQWIVSSLELPDPENRHVLAAAIKTKAGVIVTTNLKDFPDSKLEEHNIKAQYPDIVLSNLVALYPQEVIEAVQVCHQRRKNLPSSFDQYLAIQQRQELSITVSIIKELIHK